jgi:hypothetical protein
MKTNTIYILGGIAVAGILVIVGYRNGWFGEKSSNAAGSGTNPNKKRKCVDKCLKIHPNWSVEQCQRSCEPTQGIAQQEPESNIRY